MRNSLRNRVRSRRISVCARGESQFDLKWNIFISVVVTRRLCQRQQIAIFFWNNESIIFRNIRRLWFWRCDRNKQNVWLAFLFRFARSIVYGLCAIVVLFVNFPLNGDFTRVSLNTQRQRFWGRPAESFMRSLIRWGASAPFVVTRQVLWVCARGARARERAGN